MEITKRACARMPVPAILDDDWLGSWNLVVELKVSNLYRFKLFSKL